MNKKGFTLIELLAVIAILGLVLIVAVPKITKTMENSKKRTFELSAKSIAKSAEEKYIENDTYGINEEITCESVANISRNDFLSCTINFDDNGIATVTIVGAGSYDGLYICNGIKTNASATKESCTLVTLTVDLNGGTDTVDYNAKYEAGSTVTLTEPTKEGFAFNGWTVTGTGAKVEENKLTMGTENTTVTATWEKAKVNAVRFADDSWGIIIAAVQQAAENGIEYPYNVGDEKTIDMDVDGNGTAEQYTIRVANKTKCSTLDAEGKTVESKTACGFVLEFVDIITTHEMNGTDSESSTNAGGWPASEMRTYVNSTIYNALPDALKDEIINTYVVSSYGSDKTTGVVKNENAGVLVSELYWSNDKLYLLSPQEVYGTSFTNQYDSSNGTSRQLDYYATYKGDGYTGVSTTNYVGAKKNIGSVSAFNWWLRSAYSDYSNNFYFVDINGDWYYTGSYSSLGVSPAFRLAN